MTTNEAHQRNWPIEASSRGGGLHLVHQRPDVGAVGWPEAGIASAPTAAAT
jgi:hypothetical protein